MSAIFIVAASILAAIFIVKSINTATRISELKVALVGKHTFHSLSADKQKIVIDLANKRLLQGYRGSYKEGEIKKRGITLENGYDPITRYVFYALAMMELGIVHGVSNFRWMYIKNPLKLRNYDDKYCNKAITQLKKHHGINVTLS